jgi:hypothetical protein
MHRACVCRWCHSGSEKPRPYPVSSSLGGNLLRIREHITPTTPWTPKLSAAASRKLPRSGFRDLGVLGVRTRIPEERSLATIATPPRPEKPRAHEALVSLLRFLRGDLGARGERSCSLISPYFIRSTTTSSLPTGVVPARIAATWSAVTASPPLPQPLRMKLTTSAIS